jgi:Cytochrome c oxidase assembly protein CtaG/Cox11
MPKLLKKLLLFLVTVLMLALPLLLLVEGARREQDDKPLQVLNDYLKVLYARDFRHAYNFISDEDHRLKSQNDYVQERGPFTGFALEVARKLGKLIEVHPVSQQPDGKRTRIRLSMKLPDANALSGLLLDWDEQRLDNLTASQQRKILSTLDAMRHDNKLPMIEGEEEFVLIREDSRWKIYLDWADGVHIHFATTLPTDGSLAATPLIKQTVVRSGDPFTIGFRVKNLGSREIVTRIAHLIQPKDLAQYLDLVECALLLPVRLRPGEEQVFNSTYVVRGDLPDGTKAFDVTYEFKIEG